MMPPNDPVQLAESSKARSPPKFLTIPLEIRQPVYKILLEEVLVFNHYAILERKESFADLKRFAATCHQVRDELLNEVYSNKFKISMTVSVGPRESSHDYEVYFNIYDGSKAVRSFLKWFRVFSPDIDRQILGRGIEMTVFFQGNRQHLGMTYDHYRSITNLIVRLVSNEMPEVNLVVLNSASPLYDGEGFPYWTFLSTSYEKETIMRKLASKAEMHLENLNAHFDRAAERRDTWTGERRINDWTCTYESNAIYDTDKDMMHTVVKCVRTRRPLEPLFRRGSWDAAYYGSWD
ncbi:MAG: hypothetical protein M1820_003268 [Bogoriella megaspora]|nr:MAG: hypothetical protein M1820_003268 [Bogoriella megaspora]